jgi:hypothetical protein
MPEFNFSWHQRQRLFLIALISAFVLSLPPVFSQDETRILLPSTPASGALAPDAPAATFVFDATAGATASITVISSDAQPLAVALTDPSGNSVAQSIDTSGLGATQIEGALLPASGRYFVAVFYAPGTATVVENTFDIALVLAESTTSPEATVEVPEATVVPTESAVVTEAPSIDVQPTTETTTTEPIPEQILLANGLEVTLSWVGSADMNLQVRDPSGETLYWDSRSTTNGGTFGFDANGLCEIITENPVETASWQPGFLPTGSYEILVFYRNVCDETATAVPFTVSVTANGIDLGSVDGTLSPPIVDGQDSVYLTRFEVLGENESTLGMGGVYPDSSVNLLPAGFDVATDAPTAVVRDVPIMGAITNNTVYETYSFTAVAGDVVSVNMAAQGVNLDTLVQVVDPTGLLVGVNDDANNTTNSFIANLQLLTDGEYTIIATRYGKELGGTEGQYQLTLTGATADVAPELSQFQLPQGDIEISLLWDSAADLQLLVRDPVGQAVFDDVPFINSGGTLQENGNVGCVPADTVQPISYIYWPSGRIRPGTYEVEVWYQSGCSDLPAPAEFTLAVEVAGETVLVQRQVPLVNQKFVTNFTIDPSGVAVAGEAGFIGGSETLNYQDQVATAMTLVNAQPVTGVISPTNTFDVYTFSGVAGESVTLSMAASSQTLDTNMFLISPSGVQIATNDDGDPVLLGQTGRTTDSLISEYRLGENGVYTVIATRYATVYGGTIGGYTLTMRKN